MSKKSEDIRKAELERKKRDLWKCYNPTNQNMVVVLNKKISPEEWTIKAKTEEIVPWYVLEMYRDKMKERIVYAKSDKKVIEENERRLEKGFNPMNVHTEQFRYESRILKSMLGKIDELDKILIVGLYKEYGVGDKDAPEGDKGQIAQTMEVEDEVSIALGDAPRKPVEQPVKEVPKIEVEVVGDGDVEATVHDQVKKPTKKKGKIDNN